MEEDYCVLVVLDRPKDGTSDLQLAIREPKRALPVLLAIGM
jgi:hypothetical protein